MDEPDNRRLDGNALGGQLAGLFGFELTTAIRTCGSCEHAGPLGEHPAYMDGPGAVLRCPSCGSVALRVVQSPDRIWIEMEGTASLEIAR
jgi:Family of unknown function (DUF6510)